MKANHKDIEIQGSNPFKNDKLKRINDANILTRIIQSYSSGFTLALNGSWGSGKTTFLQMWKQELENLKFTTLYLNVWENDFVSEPLVAILGEFNEIIEKLKKDPKQTKLKINEKFDAIKAKAATFSKGLPKAIRKATIKKIAGDDFSELIEDTIKSNNKIFEKEISDYSQKKQNLNNFKKDLQELLESISSDKPIVFIIDELDRCRPDYAVEVLEKIKHFFSIENIVFILSIDKEQLCHSICGHYGSNKINAKEYLKRFIDIEYSLNDPDIDTFCNYLYDYFDFDQFMKDPLRVKYSDLRKDSEKLINMIHLLAKSKNLNLRQIEKLLAQTRLSLIMLDKNSYLFPDLFLLLCYLRVFHNEFYHQIKDHNLTIQEIVDTINKIFNIEIKNENTQKNDNHITATIIKLLVYYNNEEHNSNELYTTQENNFKIAFNPLNMEQCNDYISYFKKDFKTNDFKISYLLKAIELQNNK